MRRSFFGRKRPLLCAMVQDKTPEDAICTIMDSLYDGADAFGIQLENLLPEYRNEETLTKIFKHCEGKPIYITSYRVNQSKGLTDEECVALLLMGLRAGRDLSPMLCDIMGDLYCKETDQLTFEETAVAKQRALIEQIHQEGGEVLMSTHLSRFFDREEVLSYAKAQKQRGADVVKLVNKTGNEEEMMENLNTIHALKRELEGTPFLFLASGEGGHLIRQIGPALGVCMYLCTVRYRPVTAKQQPKLRSAKAIRDHMFL